MNEFMRSAIEEAKIGMRSGDGGPFGAVIVRNGKVIVRAHNEVLKTNDPTAHSEVVAIRRASALLSRFDLSDCEIISTCEPCPMCFAAIHWAKIPSLIYACTSADAAQIGFDDGYIYDVIRGARAGEKLARRQADREKALSVFVEWQALTTKQMY